MPAHIRPSIRLAALPSGRHLRDRFRFAAEAGFEGLELEANDGPPHLLREAAEQAGLAIHSVHCSANYRHPLSSGDPRTLARGIEATLGALETARLVGADTLLLIPGVVQDGTTYEEAYRRSHDVIRREILPVAAAGNIVLGIENVWNGFLLGPIEYSRYLDAFDSPFVRAYLDVGNIIFGRPEGWIDILGPRIVKLHLKDFRLTGNSARGRLGLARIGEGNIDWRKVRAALGKANFSGWGVLAEPDLIRGRNGSRPYYLLRRASAGLAPIPGATAALGPVQAYLGRRLLRDVMKRFRLHIA
jgi:L-ribulose-5-phosphate 3-epimerase